MSGWCATSRAQSGTLQSDDHAATSESAPNSDGAESKNQIESTSDPAGNELADLSLEELASTQVIVSGNRREQHVEDVPHAISVITHEDIRACGARSIPDALRLAAGVDVADLSYGQSAVSTRGLHGFLTREVLVLVDGRQIFDSLYGGTLWGSWPFQLEDIERIEVIRGPGGVIWGANAMNGVINIITKDPATQLGTTLSGGGGSRGMHKGHLGHAFQDGDLRLRVSGEYEGSDGFKTGGNLLGKLSDDYKAGRAGFMGVYDAGPSDKLTFSGGSAILDGGFPRTPLGGFGSDWTRNPGSQANFISGTWKHRIGPDNEFEINGFVNDFSASPGLPQVDYRYQQLSLQLRQTLKPVTDHTLTWGIDTRTDLLDTSNADPSMLTREFLSTESLGIYFQDDWNFAENWTLGLGARMDYEFYGGFQPSARASLMHRFEDGSNIYGAVSRSFQMPPAALRFLDFPLLNGIAMVDGHRDLRSETLVSYELGYSPRLFKNLSSNVNLFWSEYADLTTLSPRLGPPGLLAMDVDNRADASIYGLELDARYAATRRLTLLGNYTFQQMDWRSDAHFFEKDCMTPPAHKAMVGARYDLTKNLNLATHLYYVGEVDAPNVAFPFASRSIDPYFRLDVRVEKKFWKDRASFAIGVRNLLDGGHAEGATLFLNNAETPRMIYAEFRLGLGARD